MLMTFVVVAMLVLVLFLCLLFLGCQFFLPLFLFALGELFHHIQNFAAFISAAIFASLMRQNRLTAFGTFG